MDKDTRNRIQRATQAARGLLEHEYAEQLEGVFDIRLNGTIAAEPGGHLDAAQRVLRTKLVTAVEHQRASGMKRADTVAAYLREAAFTTLNRFVALKMLEARELAQECISRGDQSTGFKEFTGLAPGLVQLPDYGYRLYVESLFDEIGREVRILFDRRDPASLLWPRRPALLDLLAILNEAELAPVWVEDATIGWVYQYFNGDNERKHMRAASQAPRNSRELAVRNQFFTPRYIVQFLADNTLCRHFVTSNTSFAGRTKSQMELMDLPVLVSFTRTSRQGRCLSGPLTCHLEQRKTRATFEFWTRLVGLDTFFFTFSTCFSRFMRKRGVMTPAPHRFIQAEVSGTIFRIMTTSCAQHQSLYCATTSMALTLIPVAHKLLRLPSGCASSADSTILAFRATLVLASTE